jgi:hypothetical protein
MTLIVDIVVVEAVVVVVVVVPSRGQAKVDRLVGSVFIGLLLLISDC